MNHAESLRMSRILHARIEPSPDMAGRDNEGVLLGETIYVSPRTHELIHHADAKLLKELMGALELVEG